MKMTERRLRKTIRDILREDTAASKAAASTPWWKWSTNTAIEEAVDKTLQLDPAGTGPTDYADERTKAEKLLSQPRDRAKRMRDLEKVTTPVKHQPVGMTGGPATGTFTTKQPLKRTEDVTSMIPDAIKHQLARGKGSLSIIDTDKALTPRDKEIDRQQKAAAKVKIAAIRSEIPGWPEYEAKYQQGIEDLDTAEKIRGQIDKAAGITALSDEEFFRSAGLEGAPQDRFGDPLGPLRDDPKSPAQAASEWGDPTVKSNLGAIRLKKGQKTIDWDPNNPEKGGVKVDLGDKGIVWRDPNKPSHDELLDLYAGTSDRFEFAGQAKAEKGKGKGKRKRTSSKKPRAKKGKETLGQKAARMRAERAKAKQFGKFHENRLHARRKVTENNLVSAIRESLAKEYLLSVSGDEGSRVISMGHRENKKMKQFGKLTETELVSIIREALAEQLLAEACPEGMVDDPNNPDTCSMLH